MTKRLDITAITNELEGSAFFPGRKTPPPSPPLQTVPEIKQAEELKPKVIKRSQGEPKQSTPERANAKTPQHQNGKRIITRNSFEIYEDQMDSLRKLSFQEKMEGKLGSMSAMVREAIDTYLLKRTSKN